MATAINIKEDVREFLLSLDDFLAQMRNIERQDTNTVERNQRRVEEHLRILNILTSLLSGQVNINSAVSTIAFNILTDLLMILVCP